MSDTFPAPDAELVLAPGHDRTAPWYAARRSGIGASEIAACVDAHPYTTAVDVWRDKIGNPAPRTITDAMRRGIAMEPHIAAMFTMKTGVGTTTTGMWRHHGEHHAIANPDRLCDDGTGLEIKTHGVHSCRAWSSLEPPWYVQAQAQWTMYVTGIHTWWVASWCAADDKLTTYRLHYNPDEVAYLRHGAAAVWDCVQRRAVPRGAAPVELAALYPAPTPGAVVVDDRLSALRAQIDALTSERKRHQDAAKATAERLDDARAQVMEIMGAAETGLDSQGRTLVTWKASTRTDIDVDGLRAKAPDVAAEHTRTTSSRRLVFPKLRG